MEPTQELIDDLYRAKVLRARAMTPEERVRESLRLSRLASEVALAGIRAQHPHADADEVVRLLRQRLLLVRRLEETR